MKFNNNYNYNVAINQRIKIIIFVFFIISSVVISHFFSIQLMNHKKYVVLAERQHSVFKELMPKRGAIYTQDKDAKKIPVALNKNGFSVYVIPKNLVRHNYDIKILSEKVAKILGINKDEILKRLNKPNDPFEPIKNNLSDTEIEALKNAGLIGEGFEFLNEDYRVYPQNEFLSHVIGYYGFKEGKRKGSYGIEEYYDEILRGESGFIKAEKDASRKIIPLSKQIKTPSNGVSIILTIDQNIQFVVEEKMKEIIKKLNAESGSAIVMEPKTGKILAMVSFPQFDPNNYSKIDNFEVFKNSNIQNLYEPGSVIKPLTASIALELEKITPQTTYNDTGMVKIGGYTIKNFDGRAYGVRTMTEVLEKSLNTGAVFMQKLIGKEDFLKYFRDFGLDELTKIDLANEIRGSMINLYSNRDINFATASFGQGISVTPIELIRAFSALANKGIMMRPYIVNKIIFSDGSSKITEPKKERRVISEETSRTITKMLVSVVDHGFDKARIKGYSVAGKTGTAQIPDLKKGGYTNEFIHTFIGYAPAFNPKFIMLLKIDKPKGIKFAADSLSPVFKDIAEYILMYYKVSMDVKP